MAERVVKVNRAPVLTLWAAVVAARLGYAWEEALTLGKAIAGLSAQAKGRRLGIYEERKEERPKAERRAESRVEILGPPVPVKQTDRGLRAVIGGRTVDPASVTRYLHGRFGDDLEAVEEAMKALAASYPPEELRKVAYRLYEGFRPQVAAGTRGWGQPGELDLDRIRSLARGARKAA
jgi:hypothetical protein